MSINEQELTRGYLVSVGFEREKRGEPEDFDGEEVIYHKDGIDIYDHTDDGAGFSFATYTRYPGRGFKGGYTVKTVAQLQALYFGITGKAICNESA
jgi:hypothetical protein